MRAWIVSQMRGDAELMDLMRRTVNGVPETDAAVQERFFAAGSMTSATTPKPFVVYLLGNSTDQQLADEDYDADRQFWQVWVHDRPADYTKIDAIQDRIRAIFKNGQSVPDKVLTTIHLERSRDFDDEILKTIFKYARFQSIITKVS